MKFLPSVRFAQKMDREDPLRKFRSYFLIPGSNNKSLIYFSGNSLGLQPKSTRKFIAGELDDWATLGVEGHVNARRPWIRYHHFTKKALARLVGAKRGEVVAMNQLSVNLHLMLVSFYRPTKERYKIIMEEGAFSSDQYAIETHLKFRGMDPSDALVEIKPRQGEYSLRTVDILDVIRQHASGLALILFGGVQYYTGQYFDIEEITKAGHQAGSLVGFDLAHAVGNVPLSLHKDEVDFAVWCSYKYLNSGPGGIAGVFVHEKHGKNLNTPRFAGWWGNDEKERFEMKKGFRPAEGADGWQLSNVPVLQAAAHMAALEVFQNTGMSALRKKSNLLTGYLEFLLRSFDPAKKYFLIITPEYPDRGCQLSLLIRKNGETVFKGLSNAGVIADWREPDVIRVAPTPLYNTFLEVYRFVEIFKEQFQHR